MRHKFADKIDGVINILGQTYQSSWYDREQRLMQAQYTDTENNLQCSFVYDKMTNELVWAIILSLS